MFKQQFPVCSYFFYFCPPLGLAWAQVNLGLRINASTWVPLGAILAPLGAILAQLGVSCPLFATHWASPAIPRALLGSPWPSLAFCWPLIVTTLGYTGAILAQFGANALRLAPSKPDLGFPALPSNVALSYFKKWRRFAASNL